VKSAIGTNTKIILKRKLTSFIFLVPLLVVLFFSSLFITNAPPFIGFVIMASIFFVTDTYNIFYSIFFSRVSSLPQEKIVQEVKGLPILTLLSFVLIVGTGSMMNVPLMNYATQLSQLSLIAGLLLIINEFWLSYSVAKFYNSARKGLTDSLVQKYTSSVRGEIVSATIHIIMLIGIASKLSWPHNFISFGYLFLIAIFGILFSVKKLKEVISVAE
jgi:hypothetical protein